jgi:predicted deacetylase
LGDEVVLHGFYHTDRLPVRSPLDWVRRRMYTLEGEFAELSRLDAGRLLQQGRAELAACGWSARGFVAPAWLTSVGTIEALTPLGFDWYARRTGLVNLYTGQVTAATSLVWSVRAAWRRRLSKIYNTRLLQHLLQEAQSATPIRLGLHPVDADWPEAVQFWQNALAMVVAERPCAIKSELVMGRVHGA